MSQGLLSGPGCPQACDPPASAFVVLRYRCATVVSLKYFSICLISYNIANEIGALVSYNLNSLTVASFES